MKILPLALLFIFLPSISHAWPARVVSVADGDTITVEPADGGERIRIRLYGIDCPENNQPYGSIAKAYTTNAVLFKTVDIEEKDKDRYGRIVAVLALSSGITLQEELLQNGLAWVYTHYCRNCDPWNQIQTTAELNKKGLWKDKNPVPPWEWRRK